MPETTITTPVAADSVNRLALACADIRSGDIGAGVSWTSGMLFPNCMAEE
jgi:hypothetical protein